MPRRPRISTGGLIYHVLNRATGKKTLFHKDEDYLAFEKIIEEAAERVPVRIAAYCLMPNHWHLVLWPQEDGELSEFMRWLSVTHAQRHHAHYRTVGEGPLYQGRFKSFPVQEDRHFLAVARYVERNPVRAGKVRKAERWRWSSAAERPGGPPRPWLLTPAQWPVRRSSDWRQWVDEPQTRAEEEALAESVRRGRPFGDGPWTSRTARRLSLESSLRPRGRPPKPAAKPQGE